MLASKTHNWMSPGTAWNPTAVTIAKPGMRLYRRKRWRMPRIEVLELYELFLEYQLLTED